MAQSESGEIVYVPLACFCRKLADAGFLIVDNTEREYYTSKIGKYLDGLKKVSDCYGPVPYITWFNRTTIWQKQ